MITFEVSGQVLSCIQKPAIFSGDENLDKVQFVFDDTWEGYTKTAVFTADETYHVVLNEDNICSIPNELLKNEGSFFIGVFGISGEVVKTSQTYSYSVGKGALTEATAVPDPTPDVYAQIVSLIESGRLVGPKGDTGVSVKGAAIGSDGNLYLMLSDGTLVDAGPAKGEKGDKGDTGPQGSKGDTGAKGDRGEQGVSITDAKIDTSGHLWLLLSNGGVVDCGNAKGENGEQGERGPQGVSGPNEVSSETATSMTGLLKGNGTNIEPAVPGTDYQPPITFDEEPTEGSTNPVTSGGVFNFVNSQRNKTYKLFYSVDIDNDSTGIVQVPNIDTTDDICVMVDIPGAEDAQTSDRFRINISNKSNGSYPLLYFIDTNAFSTTEQAFCYELVLVGTVYKAYKTSIVAQSNYALSSSTVTLGTYHASYDKVFGKYIDGTVKFMTIQRIKGSGSSSDPQTFPIGTKIRVFTKE